MTTFHERMKTIASSLSPEAKEVVKKILAAEHKMRFHDRSELPEAFALEALKAAKSVETNG